MMRNAVNRWLLTGGFTVIGAALLWNALGDSRAPAVPDGWTAVNERLESALESADDAADKPAAAAANGQEIAGRRAGGAGAAKAEQANEGAAGAGEESTDMRPEAAVEPDPGLLDLNRATAEELDVLPGIGPAKARAMVEDRNRNGPFRSVDDLTRVKGIGPKLLDKLRKLVTVGAAAP